MALNGSLGFGLIFSARDLASGTMLRLGRNLNYLRRQAMGTAQVATAGFAVMGVGAAILSAGMAGLSVIERVATMTGAFDMAMAQAGARARATAADLALMRRAALDSASSGRSVFDPTETAQGLELLAAAGQTAQEAIASLRPTLGLATAGNITVESSARALISTLNAFGLQASDTDRVANQLLAISNSTLLEARDLEAAMGAIGRGASIAHQSLEEMLPAIGLVRNAGNSAEVSAHAVSAAMIYMGTHAGDRFRDIGVALEDGAGHFRPFLDVVMDVRRHIADRGIGDVETIELVNRLFGRFGMTAYSASLQVERGITTTSGAIVRGADALAYLRNEMATAGGTIDYFLDRTLNTLPGQLQVLKAVASSVAVEMGGPLAAAIKPVLAALVEGLQRFKAAWTTLPESFKTGIVRAFLLASAFLTFLGSTVLITGAVILLLPFLKVLAITMGIIALLVLPLAAGLVAAAAAVYLFGRAVNENVGGLGRLRTMGEKVVLFFRGLHAIFSEGGFAGALRDELNKAENAGLRRFVLQVGAAIYRIQKFFEGVAKGIDMFLKDAAPEMRRFLRVVERLAGLLGLNGDMLRAITGESSKTFGEAGLGAGHKIIGIFARLVDGISDAIKNLELFQGGFRAGWDWTIINIVIDRFEAMGKSIDWITTKLFGAKTEMNAMGLAGWIVGTGLCIIFSLVALALLVVVLIFGLMLVGFVIGAAIMAVAVFALILPFLILYGAVMAVIEAVSWLWNILKAPFNGPTPIRGSAIRLDGSSPAAPGRRNAAAATPARRAAARPGPMSMAGYDETGAPGGSAGGGIQFAAALQPFIAAIQNRPPPVVASTVMLDSDVLVRAMSQATNAGNARTFSMPDGGGEE